MLERSLTRSFSGDITKNFLASLNRLQEHKVDPNSSTKLKLYAFYKQAKEGPCNMQEPHFFDMAGKAKYEAWKR
jgi:acyl-CoA-binding protein